MNAPSAEGIIRQVLYGNNWFRKELGKASAEYMLPDCFGFPASLPTILAHSGVKGFSTQKLVWGSSADAGGPESLEKTPEGTPFNVGVWVGPDGESVLAGSESGRLQRRDLHRSQQAAASGCRRTRRSRTFRRRFSRCGRSCDEAERNGQAARSEETCRSSSALRDAAGGYAQGRNRTVNLERHQGDWAARVEQNGKVSGVFTDYHYLRHRRHWRSSG